MHLSADEWLLVQNVAVVTSKCQPTGQSVTEFIKRWCLNNMLAEVSSDADGSAVVRVHVPPLAAVTVPVALTNVSISVWPFISLFCLLSLWLRLPWAAVQGLCRTQTYESDI